MDWNSNSLDKLLQKDAEITFLLLFKILLIVLGNK